MPQHEQERTPYPESLGRLISCLYRYTQTYIGKELEHHGIGSGQFSFLAALCHSEGMSQEELANLFHVDKATSARAIKKLVKEGYVIRKRDPVDKRKYRILLTEKGSTMHPVLKKISTEWTETLLSGFTQNEKECIMPLLEKMVDNAFERIERRFHE
ncbi:MAG: MarR family transcriptional regulator [Theionarchaea archaeon]|nr:MAG: hypothetical protein AYK18_02685 [Theionarchaea archaeon DG-70]MBU7011734.1 MarR family transcriptional regulator [Theionarchaea archaeon]